MAAIRRHILVGVGAGFLLIMVYLGIIILAQGLTHAVEQTARLWYWVLALAGGFGVQAGLFSFIRQAVGGHGVTTGSVAASGTVSSGSMAACCAHHLSDILPLLGLSGVAIFLVRYQLFFIVAAVLSNIIGITIMLETIQRHGLCSRLASLRVSMSRVKIGAVISTVLILTTIFFLASE